MLVDFTQGDILVAQSALYFPALILGRAQVTIHSLRQQRVRWCIDDSWTHSQELILTSEILDLLFG